MMKQKNPQKWLLWVMMLVVSGAFAQTPPMATKHEFSIQQAIYFAVKNNVQVKNALLNLKNQLQVNREITASALPQINGSIGSTFNPNIAVQKIPNFISPSTYQVLIDQAVKNGNTGQPIVAPSEYGFIEAQFGSKWIASGNLSLQQLLFDGQVFVGLHARKASIDYQTKNIEVTEEVIKTNIYKIYYQLLVGKTQLALFDANISRLTKLMADTKALYDNGFAEKLDINKVSVQLANLQTQKLSADNSIATGYLGLKTLIGMSVKDTLILTDSISEDQIKNDILNDAYQYSDRKEFQLADLGKKLSEFSVKRYELSKLPTIALSGNYGKSAQRSKFDFFGKGDWFTSSSVGLNVSIPIFSGFAKDARIKQAQISLEQTNNTIANLKNQIDNDVATATMNFKLAISTMDYQKKNMELAETVYNQTKKKYEIGTGSNTEITSAQTDLTTAQTNYISALYSAIIAKIDYQKAIGKLK